MAKSKICKVCKKQKRIHQFANSAHTEDGKMHTCRDCWSANIKKGTTGVARKARNGVKQKQCKTCGEIKALDQFGKHGPSKDGYMAACKDCRSAQLQTARSNAPDKAGVTAAMAERKAKRNGESASEPAPPARQLPEVIPGPPPPLYDPMIEHDAMMMLRGAALVRGVTVADLVQMLLSQEVGRSAGASGPRAIAERS